MTTHKEIRRCAGYGRLLAALLCVALVTGCVTTVRAPAPTASPLQLLGTAELAIPHDCEVTPGAMYRTNFNVQSDGRVSDAVSASGDGCVQQALRSWVATFSYAPLPESTAVAFDWMMVSAARNH
jgi:hypothetical protein